MVLLIDGYNLLKYIIKKTYATAQEQSWLIKKLEEYATIKKHAIIVIFDGGPYVRPTYTKRGQVAILYSGTQETADEVIKDYVMAHSNDQMIVISSDNGLYSFASRLRVTTVDAQAFYTLLREQKEPALKLERSSGKAQKLQTESNPGLDELMELGTEYVLHKKEPEEQKHKQKQEKLSKEERRLLRISKKL